MAILITFSETEYYDSTIAYEPESFNDDTSLSIYIDELDQKFVLQNPCILSNVSQLALENAHKEFKIIESKLQPEICNQFSRYLKVLLMPSIFRACHDYFRISQILHAHNFNFLDYQVNIIDDLSNRRKKINQYYTAAHSNLSIHFLEKLIVERSLMNYKCISSDFQSMNVDKHLHKLTLLSLPAQESLFKARRIKTAFINGCGMRQHYLKTLLDISQRSGLLTGEFDEVFINYTKFTPSWKSSDDCNKQDFVSNISDECIKNDLFVNQLIFNIYNLLKQLRTIFENDSLQTIYVSDLINVYILASIDLGFKYKKEIVVVSHSGGPLLFRRYSRYCRVLDKLYIEPPMYFEDKFNYIVPIEMDQSFDSILGEDYPVSNVIKDNSLVTRSAVVSPDQLSRRAPDTLIIACEFYLGSFYTEDYLASLIQDILRTISWSISNGFSVIVRFRGTYQLVIPELLSSILKISVKNALSRIKNVKSFQLKLPQDSIKLIIGWNSKRSTRSCFDDQKISPILLVIGRSSSVMLEAHIAHVPVLYYCRDLSSYFVEEHRVCYSKFLMHFLNIEDVYDRINKLRSLHQVDS